MAYMSTETHPPAHNGPEARISLSVLMPGLNEEASVEQAVRRMLAALEEFADEYEVIVINDGSTDATGEIAERLAKGDDRVRVLHNEHNLNYGISLARGIWAARCDWILHDGMDLPLAPEDITTNEGPEPTDPHHTARSTQAKLERQNDRGVNGLAVNSRRSEAALLGCIECRLVEQAIAGTHKKTYATHTTRR